jgi:hypothetical protein
VADFAVEFAVDLLAGAFAVCAEAAGGSRTGPKESARRRVQGPMCMEIPLLDKLLLEAIDFNRAGHMRWVM